MTTVALADTHSRNQFFQQRITLNLRYWQEWTETKLADITAFEQERERIVNAIAFGLALDDTWGLLYELIIKVTPVMERRGHWEVWNSVLTRAVKVAHRTENQKHEVTLSALLARLSFQQGRFQESVCTYRRTIWLARQIGDEFNEARACSNLGYYFAERGQWWRSEVLCCHALVLFERLNSDHGRAHTENHLGVLYTRLHRWELAQLHLERACAIWKAMEDQHGLLRGFTNLSTLFVDSERPAQARHYLKKALDLAQSTRDEATAGTVYLNIGLANILTGEFTDAETHLRQAEKIFRDYANVAALARVWDSLGAVHFHQEKYTEAIAYLEQSLEIWRNLKNTEDEINTLLDLVEYNLAQKNHKQATIRLNELTRLVGPDCENKFYHHHQPRFRDLRRSLRDQTATEEDAF